jgi:hypothetical protein
MDRSRRTLLTALGLGILGAGQLGTGAAQERRRILPGGPAQGDIDPGGSRAQISPALAAFLTGVDVDDAVDAPGLAVVWLRAAPGRRPVEVLSLDDALERGALHIAERAQAVVPTLTVDNRGSSHVLLLAGEILVGGKQNRVVKEDVLLPPRSGPRDIGVYCVEQGRWDTGRTGFDSRGSMAAARLRSEVLQGSSQSRVWAEVDRYTRSRAAASPSRDFQAVYENPAMRERLRQVEGLLRAPSPKVTGAAVTSGTALALDVFHDGRLFARLWPKLLRAHSLDAAADGSAPTAGDLRERVRHLLAASATTAGTLRANAGVGRLFEFRVGRATGTALVFGDTVPHAAVI